ncbi:dihydropteroate synthase [Hoyosella subflava]|uniref:Dihydropteroate synthase n=1 Tax=Hoyosella subflava (strain DSM 45089 / JCM 17490 / NBRC 109087 / DQS3-9A1) TaxID=443218 RepID=F6EPJ3_HOYSD|nr:dihydropteroate synthase [Hoyosella subflava]AEF39426.1 Dihydropteroate synthase [Hoyosella subflava DQS3-9A1]
MTVFDTVEATRRPIKSTGMSRCVVLGILNVTPDSFSDGGKFDKVSTAIERGIELARQGADIIDVGGESTRPGASRVDEPEELRRVIPVIRALSESGVKVSVDTMRATVAARALDAGAVLVNDVSGGLADSAMLPFLAGSNVPCVLMHWRAHAAVMQRYAVYDSVVQDVCFELARRADQALAAGVDGDNIVLDPGLGFAKTADQSWSLLAALPTLRGLGFPILVGASRKRFLSECVDYGTLKRENPADRDDASSAVAAVAAASGAWGVRVHDTAAAAAAVRVARRLRTAGAGGL